jgi:hypothetical protein
MVRHTPTPWKLFDEGDTTAILATTKRPPKNEVVHWSGFDASHFSGKAAKANAAFIVRAVNSHDALIKALEQLEEANDKLASLRTQKQYLSMLNAGQEFALADLQDARNEAKRLLAVVGGSVKP